MRWPFVSRARYDVAVARLEKSRDEWSRDYTDWARRYDQSVQFLQDRNTEWAQRYEALMEKYHALRVSGANAPEPEKIIPPPKRPPAIVYRAMRAISPRDDATFAANWRLWEENQEECDKDPEAFATRIKRGRMTSEQPRAD